MPRRVRVTTSIALPDLSSYGAFVAETGMHWREYPSYYCKYLNLTIVLIIVDCGVTSRRVCRDRDDWSECHF